jgi:hypothetical protein
MKKDIAIEEIREVRHRISERFGHDTKALLDHYRELEKKYKDRMVTDTSEQQHEQPERSQP